MTDHLVDWAPGRAGRIAGVSSFGFSGTNCHVVVGEPPPEPLRSLAARPEIVPVSARTEAELDAHLRRLADALTPHHVLADVAFTLATGRRHLAARAAVIANDVVELRGKLLALAAGTIVAGCSRAGVGSVATDLPASPGADPGTDLVQSTAAYVEGRALEWHAHFGGRPVRRVALPTYPFSNARHWVTAAPPVQSSGRTLNPDEPLIADHQVDGRRMLAGAASVEFVVAAAQRGGLQLPLRLGRLRWLRPLVVDRPTPLHIEVEDGTFRVGDAEQPHCTGTIEAHATEAPRIDLAAVRVQCTRAEDIAALYRSFDDASLRYGPLFRPPPCSTARCSPWPCS
ncbi:MAG: hypothetical protein E6J91_16885 [Deltaproteobacteria bacterium]|nr:MAG: hypothetical protein E6J91_16885 [Deltaproteobacteria bacterium]